MFRAEEHFETCLFKEVVSPEGSLVALDKLSKIIAEFLNSDSKDLYYLVFALLLFDFDSSMSGLDLAMILKNLKQNENYSSEFLSYAIKFVKERGFTTYSSEITAELQPVKTNLVQIELKSVFN